MSHIKEWKKFEDLCISHSIDRALLEQAEARERFETESGKRIESLDSAAIYPANLYIAPKDKLQEMLLEMKN